ncbi:glycosyl transferase family protein [Caballeronia udeis]|uniref:Glycosyl transferase family protein n=1 Tax=Caballeronia udeis TaxID=1232866 RepID=A0A158GQQ3_9BURK|nr:glycosyltransferase family 2 protein [Caballeronia udeis]SAL34151.1 glycosyl transferase family protein [Caballeronia udeis]
MSKISVVTISYNQGKYLRRCIDSVLSQRDVDVEMIVVDPGSADESRSIINSYGDHVIPVFEADTGPADGLNHGFSRATGQIYYFVNADDFLLPDALSFVDNFFSREREVDVLHGGGYVADQHDKLVRRYYPSLFGIRLFAYGAINLFQQGFFFRSRVYRASGGFNENNRVCWDGELFLQFKLHGSRFYGVSRPLAAFRRYQETITGGASYRRNLDVEYSRLFADAMGRARKPYDRRLGQALWGAKQFTIIFILLRSWVRGYA